ncbi:hypothetical protein BJV78DRAFT_1282369 [Lactifluus subvellereus]|nr:hypothetical protein BJV78DRAFT_1282369 [Lactifluus subvellereus]
MSRCIKYLELKNLPKSPTPLRSVNFRHTTPGSGVVLITKHTSQLTSELFDQTYPGAHLSLDKRQSLAPRWVSPHLTLYVFPKAFLSRPDAPYSKPHKSRAPEASGTAQRGHVDAGYRVQLARRPQSHRAHQDQAQA